MAAGTGDPHPRVWRGMYGHIQSYLTLLYPFCQYKEDIFMASIQKRGSSYRIRVYDYSAVDGTQHIRSMTWTPTPGMTERQIEKELNRQATLFEESVKHGTMPDSTMKIRQGSCVDSSMRLKDFCELWFKDYAEPTLKARTLREYRQMTKRVYTAIGHLPLSKIKPTHLIEFQKQLMQTGIRERQGQHKKDGTSARVVSDKPLSPKTVKNYMMFISSVLSAAVRWEYIESNPALKVEAPRAVKPHIRILDDADLKTFLAALDTEPIERKALFYTAVFTGMRRGELVGLQWKDIDYNACTIHVERTVQYQPGKGVYIDTPKTESSNRYIKVSPVITAMLREHQTQQFRTKMQLGDAWKDQTGWVFTTWDGNVMHPSTPYKQLQYILKKAGLESVSLHSLRHSNATLLINSGANVKAVSTRLGHSNVSTTTNIYAEAIASADAAAAAALDEALLTPKSAKKSS